MSHIERMVLELDELSEKIVKGKEFLDKELVEPKFTDDMQRFLLDEQLKHMIGYMKVLVARIEYDFSK